MPFENHIVGIYAEPRSHPHSATKAPTKNGDLEALRGRRLPVMLVQDMSQKETSKAGIHAEVGDAELTHASSQPHTAESTHPAKLGVGLAVQPRAVVPSAPAPARRAPGGRKSRAFPGWRRGAVPEVLGEGRAVGPAAETNASLGQSPHIMGR